jgi:hypothetical protein
MASVKDKAKADPGLSMPGGHEDDGLVATLRESYYGGSVSELAAALGTSRDTARNWSTGEPRRPRRSTLVRVRLLFGLCRAAERYMASDRQVGEWTLAPHPAFGGMSPAQALADEGFAAYRRLRNELVDYVPARPDLPSRIDESSPTSRRSRERRRSRSCRRSWPRPNSR